MTKMRSQKKRMAYELRKRLGSITIMERIYNIRWWRNVVDDDFLQSLPERTHDQLAEIFIYKKTKIKNRLVARVPLSGWKNLLRVVFPKRTFEKVFEETIADVLVEYMDALSKGRTQLARWIVARGHMIILTTVAYYVFSSTIGKLIRDLIKPTRMTD